MRVPIAEVGRHGSMDLAFVLQDGETILSHAYCEVPFKITRLLNSGEQPAHLILMHCTAGLFGGDELECSIRVERGARVLITQQSATKIHPSEERPAIQRMSVFVESGAELQLYLEPLIPFTGSSLQQTTQINVERGGGLVFWEGLMAGRIGRGERWQFKQLGLETQLRFDNRLVYLDRLLLPTCLECSPRVMGECSYLGTGFYVGDHARTVATALHEAMPEAGVDGLKDEVALVRVVTATGPEFQRAKERLCRIGSGRKRLANAGESFVIRYAREDSNL